ncbi:unnamed protein product, partial [Prorocentrum cordatum]
MASVLALGLLYDLDCENWDKLPQGFPHRPTSGQLAEWWTCGSYSDVNATVSGRVCADGDDRGAAPGGRCETQRARCGEAWEAWLCSAAAPGGVASDAGLQFALLVAMCLLRRACVAPAESQGGADARGGGAAGAPLVPADAEGASASTVSSWASRAARHLGAASLPGLVWGCSTCLLWLSMTALALFQSQTNVISLGYLVLIILDVFASQRAATQDQPIRRRIRVIRFIRYFNLTIFAAWTLFQSPLVPCPKALLLHHGDSGEFTSFTSPLQCFVLETCSSRGVLSEECQEVRKRVDWNAGGKSFSPEGEFTMSTILSIFLQVMGFHKRMSVAGVDQFGLLNLLVFVFGTIQAVICSTYGSDLEQEIEAGRRVLERHAEEYVAYTHKLRSLEVSRVDTKHRILRSKLQDLVSHLNELHGLRMGRAELSEWEQGERERQRERRVHVLDLCLQSGGGYQDAAARRGRLRPRDDKASQ